MDIAKWFWLEYTFLLNDNRTQLSGSVTSRPIESLLFCENNLRYLNSFFFSFLCDFNLKVCSVVLVCKCAIAIRGVHLHCVQCLAKDFRIYLFGRFSIITPFYGHWLLLAALWCATVANRYAITLMGFQLNEAPRWWPLFQSCRTRNWYKWTIWENEVKKCQSSI